MPKIIVYFQLKKKLCTSCAEFLDVPVIQVRQKYPSTQKITKSELQSKQINVCVSKAYPIHVNQLLLSDIQDITCQQFFHHVTIFEGYGGDSFYVAEMSIQNFYNHQRHPR